MVFGQTKEERDRTDNEIVAFMCKIFLHYGLLLSDTEPHLNIFFNKNDFLGINFRKAHYKGLCGERPAFIQSATVNG